MIPCTRASGRSCWRIWSSPTKSWITAFSAFTPRQGQEEACVAVPWNSALTLMMPSDGRHTCVPPRPWIIIAASTSRKTPASINRTLPAPPSSAGVPITWMRPANGKVPSATASAAPAPDATLDLGAVLLEELGEPAVRFLFLEAELRVVVDLVRQRLEVVGEPVDRAGDPLLHVARGAHFVLLNSS